jgi:hypothetical protein
MSGTHTYNLQLCKVPVFSLVPVAGLCLCSACAGGVSGRSVEMHRDQMQGLPAG